MVLSQKQRKAENNQHHNFFDKADAVDITYYSDPLCCWSWAFEPQWRKLRYEFADRITWKYCMGGLLPGWSHFHDPVNSVSRPIQMGPVWMHASQLSGMPIQHNLWMKDPPASSYPACIAVKCAEAQSLQIGDTYLRMLREAVMIDGKNISKQTVLIDIANELSKPDHTFDPDAFKEDLKNEKGLEAFRNDMQQVRYHNINRFPTLILRRPRQSSMLITGYRPYIVLIEALKKISPNLRPLRIAETEEQYARHWTSILPREIQEGISKI